VTGPRGMRACKARTGRSAREIVSRAQARIREAVTRNKKEKLTALLHYVSVDSLHSVFFDLKKDAAPGIDG